MRLWHKSNFQGMFDDHFAADCSPETAFYCRATQSSPLVSGQMTFLWPTPTRVSLSRGGRRAGLGAVTWVCNQQKKGPTAVDQTA